MSSSDDLAEQQLFAEIQASAKKAPRPPSAAVQNAFLLNSARVDRRRTVAGAVVSSSPSHNSDTLGRNSLGAANGSAGKGGARKLKRPSFLRDDLARHPRRSFARRGDPFEIEVSPEKSPVKQPAKVTKKTGKQPKTRTRWEVSADEQAIALSSDAPRALQAEEEAPLPSSPSPTVEVPETLQRTSGRLAEETVSLSQVDFLKKPEQQVPPRKRKVSDQPSAMERRSKSPKKHDATESEETVETIPAKRPGRPRRSKGVDPQVVIPAPKASKRNDRRSAGKQAQTEPTMADAVSVQTGDGDDLDPVHTETGHQEEEGDLNAGEDESGQEPPESAQKPLEQETEPEVSQKIKRRKFKRLNPMKVPNGLEILSDDEGATTRRAAKSKLVEQEPESAAAEKAQRRKGKEPKASRKAIVSEQVEGEEGEQESRPLELRPKRGRGRPSKASKDVAITSDHDNAGAETSGRSEQVRPKPRKTGRVPKATSEPVRSRKGKQPQSQPQTNDDEPDHSANELEDLSDINDIGINSDQPIQPTENTDTEGHAEEDEPQSEDGQKNEDGVNKAHLSDLEIVLKYLDAGERDGGCQTKDATTIQKACQTALETLADSDTTLEEVSTTTKSVENLLAKYGAESDDKERKTLKVDAYGYLFRHLVSYLETLHDWLQQQYGNVEKSIKAIRIITPFTCAIVSLKDTIAAWKVSIPTRYKGDRFIKSVDIELIVPLRRLSETYRTILRGLRDDLRRKRANEELARKLQEQQQLEDEKWKYEELRKKKLNDWIDLHVARLKVEPSYHRRQALAFKHDYFDKKIPKWSDDAQDASEERDANGVPFSRVDIFRRRVAPPVNPSLAGAEKEWTDEEVGALVDGLSTFAGADVFQRVFEHYCHPGDLLRRFSALEITAKAADVKAQLLARYQEKGWTEVPGWIERIPVLP